MLKSLLFYILFFFWHSNYNYTNNFKYI
jgi:hypothetical protein